MMNHDDALWWILTHHCDSCWFIMMHHHECCYNLGGIFPSRRNMGGFTPHCCCRNLSGGGGLSPLMWLIPAYHMKNHDVVVIWRGPPDMQVVHVPSVSHRSDPSAVAGVIHMVPPSRLNVGLRGHTDKFSNINLVTINLVTGLLNLQLVHFWGAPKLYILGPPDRTKIVT